MRRRGAGAPVGLEEDAPPPPKPPPAAPKAPKIKPDIEQDYFSTRGVTLPATDERE